MQGLQELFGTEITVLTWAPAAILLLPLLAFVVMLFAGKRMDKGADYFAIGVMGTCFLLSVTLFLVNLRAGGAQLQGWETAQRTPFVVSVPWMTMGGVSLGMGFLVDNLSSFMCIVVTGLATLVLVYSIFYMHGDTMYRRYFAYMCFFCFAMLGIVLSNNLLMTFVFWELVGLGSYFLIGFWFYKPPVSKDHHYQELKARYATGIDERFLSPAYAQRKAFVMNRVGDFGFLSGIMIFMYVMLEAGGFDNGPLDFTNLYKAVVDQGAFDTVMLWGLSGETLLTIAGILTFMGAIGKSAQFPLHTWLPDAMQGPTTGSSIIHAATMVAAGVYMVARIHPLLNEGSLFFVAMIGGITAFLAATMAMVQWDLKAVLAYSTISQLGYMMIGLGAGAYGAGVAHLYTHAIFKCMLFLCAGSVIHACHHLQDMNRMGGLRKKLPVTYIATLFGVLAISGVPLFSGFYSKDAILAGSLAAAIHHKGLHWLPYILGQITAALTAFYMCRLLFWTFHGQPRDRQIYEHAHEDALFKKVGAPVLMILALLCFGFWWGGHLVGGDRGPVPVLSVEAKVIDHHGELEPGRKGWVDATMTSPVELSAESYVAQKGREEAAHHVHVHHTAHVWATLFSVVGLLLGGLLAAMLYWWKALDPGRLVRAFPMSLGVGYEMASQLWFFDRLYQDGVVPVTKFVCRVFYAFDFGVIDQILVDGWAYFIRAVARVARDIDNWFVDRCVDLFGWVTWFAGAITRTLQAGKIQYYVCVTFGAVAVVVLVLMMV